MRRYEDGGVRMVAVSSTIVSYASLSIISTVLASLYFTAQHTGERVDLVVEGPGIRSHEPISTLLFLEAKK